MMSELNQQTAASLWVVSPGALTHAVTPLVGSPHIPDHMPNPYELPDIVGRLMFYSCSFVTCETNLLDGQETTRQKYRYARGLILG